MNSFLSWLITSSADPRKTSLAVKGGVILIGSQAVRLLGIACSFGLACLGVDVTLINQLADGIEALIYGALVVIGLSMTLYGLARKAYLARWSAPK
jgi:hypothetical protein